MLGFLWPKEYEFIGVRLEDFFFQAEFLPLFYVKEIGHWFQRTFLNIAEGMGGKKTFQEHSQMCKNSQIFAAF